MAATILPLPADLCIAYPICNVERLEYKLFNRHSLIWYHYVSYGGRGLEPTLDSNKTRIYITNISKRRGK